jgi:hypothetical protein
MRYHSGLAVGHIDGNVRTEAVGATCGSPQDNHATENPETETELDLKSTDHLDSSDSDDSEFGLDNFEDDLGDDNEGNDGEGEEEDEVDHEDDELQMSMYDMYGPIGVYWRFIQSVYLLLIYCDVFLLEIQVVTPDFRVLSQKGKPLRHIKLQFTVESFPNTLSRSNWVSVAKIYI